MLQTQKFLGGSKLPLSELLINQVYNAFEPVDYNQAEEERIPWREWLHLLFPAYTSQPFAQRHIEFWEWIEAIEKNERPRPFVAIWSRAGGKSTSAELACVRVGANRSRKYIWVCCGTQEQADKHVETIASMLESDAMRIHHPAMADRALSKYGYSRGWRRQRLRTHSGFTIDSIGLDVATRGAKVEEQRPDMILFDDLDDKHDTMHTVQKKIETITTNILPAGSPDLAVLFIQNLIHPNSIATQLTKDDAPFITDRILSGPHPAVEKLVVESQKDKDGLSKNKITSGTATWAGQSLDMCQQQIITWGLTSFLQEAQHEVTEAPGGIYNHIEFAHCDLEECPDFVDGAVWVDPAITATDSSDCQGIQVDAISEKGILYRLFSWEQVASPEIALRKAILKAIEYGFGTVGVETDQGGDVWRPAYQRVWDQLLLDPNYARVLRGKRMPEMTQAKAGSGHGSKVERSMRMLVSYETGKIVHVLGTHDILERALRRFPHPPLDLADAAYWGWYGLMGGSRWSMGMS
jgi:hypothetical protein